MKWEKIASFASGGGFLLLLLILALCVPSPTAFQLFIFRVILAVSAGAFGALIPGFLNLEGKIKQIGLVRAGGGLALFIIVYLVNPPELITQTTNTP